MTSKHSSQNNNTDNKREPTNPASAEGQAALTTPGSDRLSIMQLQRVLGNQETMALLKREENHYPITPSPQRSLPPLPGVIQRQAADPPVSSTIKAVIEIPLSKNGSIEFRYEYGGKSLEAEATSGNTSVSGEAIKREIEIGLRGKSLISKIEAQVMNFNLERKLWQGLEFSVEGELFTTEFDFEEGDISDLAKIEVSIKGELYKDETAKHLQPHIAKNISIFVIGKYEIEVDYADLANLARYHHESKVIAEHTTEYAKKKDALKKQEKIIKDIKKKLKRRNPPNKGTLRKQLTAAKDKVSKLQKSLKTHKEVIGKASSAAGKALKQVKGQAGKALAKVMGKAGVAFLKKAGAKLIPIVNVASTIGDLVEIAGKLSEIDKLTFLGDSDEDSDGEDGGGENENDAEDSEDTEDAGLYDTVQDPYEGTPTINSNAQRVYDSLLGEDGIDFKEEERNQLMRDLDGAIPANLTSDQINKVVEILKQKGGPAITDRDVMIGYIIDVVHHLKKGVDFGDSTGADSTDDSTDEASAFDQKQARQYNPVEQRVLGWDPQDLTGESMAAGSDEFATWAAEFQASAGNLTVDGVFGPASSKHWHEVNGKTDSPVYKKAINELKRRGERTAKKRKEAQQALDTSETYPLQNYMSQPFNYMILDKKQNLYVPNNKAVADVKGKSVEFSNGLKLKITDVLIQNGSVDEEEQQFSVEFALVVTQLPKGSTESGEIKINALKQLSWTSFYNRKNGQKLNIASGEVTTGTP